MKHSTRWTLTLVLVLSTAPAFALVWYDTGRLTIDGVELFQDADQPTHYYYLPPAPSLAMDADGNPQLLCLKYIDPEGQSSGGLFHLLASLELPPDRVAELEEELKEKRPGATIVGALNLMEAKAEEGVPATASFQVVSAVLSDSEDGGFTRSLITSGHAPLTAGSRAAVAASLDPRGATLLFESLTGVTSDVSVSIAAEYEAKVRGYNATVTAEVATIYEHMSAVYNKQEGFKKRELRQVVDELYHDNVIQVEVFDRTKSLGINASAVEGILNLVTDKIVSLMFDHESGLAKMPEKEVAVTKGQIRGRQERGAFVKFFAGVGNQKYMTDDQFVLKSRQDIRRTTFYLNLAQDTTVRMPVYLAGNMGGLYEEHKDNPDIFRVINLGDPSFQIREVRFVLDGEWAAAFDGIVNWVSVQLLKEYDGDQPAVDGQAQLTAKDVTEGQLERAVSYPRLGVDGPEWLDYRYRVNWSLLRRDTVSEPADGEWLVSSEPVITLRPPLAMTEVELEVDRDAMIDRGIRVGVVEVRSRVMGESETRRAAVLRVTDAESVITLNAIHDPDAEPDVRITWIAVEGGGRQVAEWQGMGVGYLWIEVPDLLGGAS
jgi:hypothetical protein